MVYSFDMQRVEFMLGFEDMHGHHIKAENPLFGKFFVV